MELRVCSQCVTLILPSKPSGIKESRLMVSTKSRSSGCSSSMALISSRNLSISVMNRETMSAMHLLVLPLSSRIVMGRSSFIRSRAAGQSSRNLRTNTSIVGNSSLCTCLKATLNWTRNLEQAAVYSWGVMQSQMCAFSRFCRQLITEKRSAWLGRHRQEGQTKGIFTILSPCCRTSRVPWRFGTVSPPQTTRGACLSSRRWVTIGIKQEAKLFKTKTNNNRINFEGKMTIGFLGYPDFR